MTQSEKQKITNFLRKKYQEGQFKDRVEFRKEVEMSLGVKKTRAREIVNQIIDGIGDKFVKKEKFDKKLIQESNENKTEVSLTTSVSSLEDVIKTCNIDTNIWNVDRYSIEQGANDKSGNPQFRWKLNLERRIDNVFDNYLDLFIKKAECFAPKKFIYNTIQGKKDCVYFINIQDLHLGKLATQRQTGWDDYDVKIAKKLYTEAVDELIEKVPKDRIDKILLIVGSDLIHYENNRNQTTSGTQIEGDSRWQKMFEESCDLMTSTIEKLAQNFNVDVITVHGNHGNLSEHALGCYLKAFFRNNTRVTIDNGYTNRKYYKYGKNLIGFTHGDDAEIKKGDDMAITLFRENQSDISNFKHLFFIFGHFHSETQFDKKGIRCFIAPALCAPDHWHSKKNFVGNVRTSQGMLFSKEDGLEAIYYSKSL